MVSNEAERPGIAVIMPVWNGAAHLGAAIESILKQTAKDFEFLIIDDGSTDGTVAMVESYQDPRIRLIRQEHAGIVVALNRGVAEARAEWIARMDADDIAYPDRLERQLCLLKRRPGAVLCHTQIRIVGEARYVTPAGRFVRSEGLTLLRLCYQCPIVHPTVMFRKDAFLACGGYLADERHAEDFGLWGRLVQQGSIIGIATPLLDLRVHHGSISKQQADVQMELSRRIALRHCREFMDLDQVAAERALDTLRNRRCDNPLRDWWWLIWHCLPRLRKQGPELWVWALQKTVFRILHFFT